MCPKGAAEMVRVVAILVGIFLAAYAAVHLGYARLENELLHRSCCSVAEQPPVDGNQEGKTGEEQSRQPQPTNSPLVDEQTPNRSVEQIQENDSTPADINNGKPHKNLDLQVIIHRNIFQLIPEETPEKISDQQPVAAQEEIPQPVPTTSLKLTLQGTILGDDQTSRAIIIDGNKKEQKLYRIGDAVQGAIIESIERGKVILEVFGAKETLTMKKREGGGPGLPNLPNCISPPVRRPTPDIEDENIEDIEDIEDIEEVEEDGPREEIKRGQNSRRPPSIRPHRRINFRRNPIRTRPDMDVEEEEGKIMDEEERSALEEELPPLD
ncbi:MAG: hypothetical protein D3910_22265 [Candidatus Electrothrix sp. ATG2]|nr:hypothetical protein [Candidatus Electrothrix sp. ATG2]